MKKDPGYALQEYMGAWIWIYDGTRALTGRASDCFVPEALITWACWHAHLPALCCWVCNFCLTLAHGTFHDGFKRLLIRVAVPVESAFCRPSLLAPMRRPWLLLMCATSTGAAGGFGNTSDDSSPSLHGRRLKQPVTLQIICGLDVTGAIGAVGQVGAGAHFVHRDCAKTDTPQEKAACSTGVSALVARTMFLVTFITSAAATCADTFDVPVFCAHSAFELTGSLALVSTAGSAFQLSCGSASQSPSVPLAPAVRRLEDNLMNKSQHEVAPLPAAPRDVLSSNLLAKVKAHVQKKKDRDAELSDCVFTSLVLSQFAIRGGVLIAGAAKSCANSRDSKVPCLTDISGILACFIVMGALIGLVSSECPVGRNFKALCATDVMTMVSAIGFLFESVGKMLLNCDVPLSDRSQIVAVDDALAGFLEDTKDVAI